ncbi:protein artemis-like [Ornithodoros turicata]|uniref:protein artemis-like n=1 Tax=Ornithodoros turicata TaxID=34597 RepID=UPI0031397A4C
MSTFGGTLQEYDRISIDNFTEHNLRSTVFLLSHCHKDHMNGLSSQPFFDRLQSRSDVKLYLSEVSCILLLNDPEYEHLKPYTVTIPVDCPTTIKVPSDTSKPAYSVVVTLISAEHCPGSTMFYLEGLQGNVLYTGDFRLSGSERQLQVLYDEDGSPKPLKCAYVDTTFCFPGANYIPGRIDCSEALVNLVKPFLAETDCHILLDTFAQYGYEHLYQVLWHTFGMKVHVGAGKMNRYKGLESIQEAMTLDASSTRFHAKVGYTNCRCPLVNYVAVKLSTMWFVNHVTVNNLVERIAKNSYRVCYSMHASLTEVRNLLEDLQPERICANVKLDGWDVVKLVQPSSVCKRHKVDNGHSSSVSEDKKSGPVWSYWSSDENDSDND